MDFSNKRYVCKDADYEWGDCDFTHETWNPEYAAKEYAQHYDDNHDGWELRDKSEGDYIDVDVKNLDTGEVLRFHVSYSYDLRFSVTKAKEDEAHG